MQLELNEREQLLQSILRIRPGIYGAEVCQLCGELDTFLGWADATGTHWTDGGEFVCHRELVNEPVEDVRGWQVANLDGPRRLLQACDRRWCEVCQNPIDRRTAERVGRYYLCSNCAVHGVGAEALCASRRYLQLQSDEELLRLSASGGEQPSRQEEQTPDTSPK